MWSRHATHGAHEEKGETMLNTSRVKMCDCIICISARVHARTAAARGAAFQTERPHRVVECLARDLARAVLVPCSEDIEHLAAKSPERKPDLLGDGRIGER